MTDTRTPESGQPQTTKAKLVRIGELAVDHTLALLETAKPGSLNAHQLKTILQLLRDASVSPTESDREREREAQEARRRALATPFNDDGPLIKFEFPDDSHHRLEAEERRRRGEDR